jgi:hypothetical protein
MRPSLDLARNRGILLQRQVRIHLIVLSLISLIAAKQVTKMLLTEDNDMIRATRQMEPMSLSAYPFCQGGRNGSGRLSSHTELGWQPASISILISSGAAKIRPPGRAPWTVQAAWVPLVFLNSISFCDTEVNLARPFRRAQTCHAKRVHKKRGCDHATGQASFEEETHNQGRRRDGSGCDRTGSFAVGQCIGIHDAHC